MELDYWKGYLAVFNFLDLYWEKYKLEIDDLAMVLGSMNPNIWEGGLPIDREMVIQWLNIFQDGNLFKESASIEECFVYMITYLKQQEKNYGADLKSLIVKLESVQKDKEKNKELWTAWLDICLNIVNEKK